MIEWLQIDTEQAKHLLNQTGGVRRYSNLHKDDRLLLSRVLAALQTYSNDC